MVMDAKLVKTVFDYTFYALAGLGYYVSFPWIMSFLERQDLLKDPTALGIIALKLIVGLAWIILGRYILRLFHANVL
jgi:hypothetical protein